jgi:hypothetical protein
MKWLITLAALATVLVVAGTSAAGSTAKDPRVPALQKKVTALETQIATLQQQVQHDELVLTCGFAQQDAYNILNLNLWATLLGVAAYNGPAPNDGGACSKLGLPAPSSRTLPGHSSLGAIAGVLGAQLRLTHAR